MPETVAIAQQPQQRSLQQQSLDGGETDKHDDPCALPNPLLNNSHDQLLSQSCKPVLPPISSPSSSRPSSDMIPITENSSQSPKFRTTIVESPKGESPAPHFQPSPDTFELTAKGAQDDKTALIRAEVPQAEIP